jgi:hypothetical protein
MATRTQNRLRIGLIPAEPAQHTRPLSWRFDWPSHVRDYSARWIGKNWDHGKADNHRNPPGPYRIGYASEAMDPCAVP